jgi:hypothetical protein
LDNNTNSSSATSHPSPCPLIIKNSASGIKISGVEGNATLFVYSLNGKPLLIQKIANSDNDIVLPLSKNTYIVKVKTSEGKIDTKLIKI